MEWLKISTSTVLVRIPTEDIVYIKAEGNYSNLYLVNKNKDDPYRMLFQLHYFDDAFKNLKNNFFIRVGKSLIVNKNYICAIDVNIHSLRLYGSRLHSDFILKASREALKELKALIEQEGDRI